MTDGDKAEVTRLMTLMGNVGERIRRAKGRIKQAEMVVEDARLAQRIAQRERDELEAELTELQQRQDGIVRAKAWARTTRAAATGCNSQT